jgi:hypothetical protein
MNWDIERGADDAGTAGREWRSLIEALLPLGDQVAEMFPESTDPQLRQDMLKMVYSELGTGFMQMVHANAEYPDLVPCWSQVFSNNGNLNPDGVYYFTPIDDDGIYRLSGFRESVHIVDLQVGDSSVFSAGKMNEDQSLGATLANYDPDLDGLHLGENGEFDCILSGERPDGYAGDWWHLPPRTNYMLVRQFSYDWINEVDARIAIERLDRPAARPRQPIEEIQAALERIPEFIHSSLKTLAIAAHAEHGLASPAIHNNVVLIDYARDQAGRAAQLYVAGRFEIAGDEALMVQLNPGACRYWNIHVCNELTSTLDFMNRLIGLNGFQAAPAADGSYHLVIASADPGVPNWLDTMNHERGFIWGRMDSCANSDPPVTKKVKLSDVRSQLPSDTPAISAEQRDAEIRLRRKGAQLRRRW